MTDDRLIYSFPKNSRETVRASLGEYHGRQLADVRVYVAADVGQPIATKKGLSVRVEELPHLLAAVSALIAAAEERQQAA